MNLFQKIDQKLTFASGTRLALLHAIMMFREMNLKWKSKPAPGNFEKSVLPHLDAAYNLARWLTRNGQDAEDAVQEACLRAFRFFGSFRGGDARNWLLKIVRNTCYTQLQKNRPQELATFDEEIHSEDEDSMNPETLLLRSADSQLLRQALEELPVNLREVLVLRELEGLSYREIAEVSNIPPGTVMSSLSRARERLRQSLTSLLSKDAALTGIVTT
jgi:RNA polymerase sigma-70 factor (ECF subfamily)